MKDKLIVTLFIIILFGFSILGLIIKDRDISIYERRKLTNINKLNEDFIGNLDDYLVDQFPFRDVFISTNSLFNRYILRNSLDNNVYIQDGYIIEKNYPDDKISINNFINKINYIKNTYLNNSEVFYTIIPDKSFFLNNNSLKMNYNQIIDTLNNNLNSKYIDIIPLLTLKDYYKTDIHIKQENYPKVIKEFSKYLNFSFKETSYKENIYDNFCGASYSKVPIFTKKDKLTYLSNDIIDNANVWHLEYGSKNVYDIEKLESTDAYNVFLSGPSSLIKIENNKAPNDSQLIVFRDSFASSFVPLLIPYYKNITLIDLRYINMDLVSNYVDLENKEILFAYSTLIINNSSILKVNINNN